MNMRNPSHAGDEACQLGETLGRCPQKFKTGVPVAPKKGPMPSNHLRNKFSTLGPCMYNKDEHSTSILNLWCTLPTTYRLSRLWWVRRRCRWWRRSWAVKSWRVKRPGSNLHSRDRQINHSTKNMENVDKVDQIFPVMRTSFARPCTCFKC